MSPVATKRGEYLRVTPFVQNVGIVSFGSILSFASMDARAGELSKTASIANWTDSFAFIFTLSLYALSSGGARKIFNYFCGWFLRGKLHIYMHPVTVPVNVAYATNPHATLNCDKFIFCKKHLEVFRGRGILLA